MKWWACSDLNRGPSDYESPALTAELQARNRGESCAECRWRQVILPSASWPFRFSRVCLAEFQNSISRNCSSTARNSKPGNAIATTA